MNKLPKPALRLETDAGRETPNTEAGPDRRFVAQRCMIRCMRRTNIYLQDRQTEALDRLAEAAGVSRAEVLRQILDRGLAGQSDATAADLAAIDLSFGCLAEIVPEAPPRGLDARDDYLSGIWGGA